MVKINMFQSGYGDSLLVQIDTKSSGNTNILIDCGFRYNDILVKIKKLLGDKPRLDRFIITHYDADHIQGAMTLIKENGLSASPKNIEIKQVWLNSYRHLQFFDRDESEVTSVIQRKIEAYKDEKTTQTSNLEGPVSAAQASKLASEIFKNKYNWNSDANGRAICIENIKSVNINSDVKIQLLSPNQNKLKNLEKSFIADLSSMGLKPQKGELFDDAFELYSQSIENQQSVVDGQVSSSEISISSEGIKKLSVGKDYVPDKAVGNGSSISFILEWDDKKVLFLGDAHAEDVVDSIKKIYGEKGPFFFDAVKVSHHGSFNNNGPELYSIIDSDKFLFSTNGRHPSHKHPDISTICTIINRPISFAFTSRKLIFNYDLEHLKEFNNMSLQKEFNYTMHCTETVVL